MERACDQHQKTSLHIGQIDGMIFDFGGAGLCGATIFFRQIFGEPFVNEAHL